MANFSEPVIMAKVTSPTSLVTKAMMRAKATVWQFREHAIMAKAASPIISAAEVTMRGEPTKGH